MIRRCRGIEIAAVGQDCTSNDFAEFSEVQGTVLRLLSWPGYTGFDEKTLNRSGDLAAVAVMRNVSVEAMDTPQNARQILLILEFAFEASHLLTKCNRNPTATLILLDHLQHSQQVSQNELHNTEFLISTMPLQGSRSLRLKESRRLTGSIQNG